MSDIIDLPVTHHDVQEIFWNEKNQNKQHNNNNNHNNHNKQQNNNNNQNQNKIISKNNYMNTKNLMIYWLVFLLLLNVYLIYELTKPKQEITLEMQLKQLYQVNQNTYKEINQYKNILNWKTQTK